MLGNLGPTVDSVKWWIKVVIILARLLWLYCEYNLQAVDSDYLYSTVYLVYSSKWLSVQYSVSIVYSSKWFWFSC